MDVDAQQAPPVVAVVVAHEPGPWFETVLAALAAQDYPNLKHLVLVADGPTAAEVPSRVAAVLPGAFVRAVGSNPGFGPAANQVLRLVDGESGFFLFLHDDIALDPSAVRLLVEELYRSNAGIVGPKIVDWDDTDVLQHVGMAVDHLGAVDDLLEPRERDQEQHDAVRDVFALPSACLLVRADLFRAIGGFDPAIDYHGEDVELCWRAHLSGARVVVVPSARARHRENLVGRRPDLDHVGRRARHRMRSFATLTGGRRVLLRLPVLLVTVIAELVTGLFAGRAREGRAGMTAMVGLLPRLPVLLARRRAVKSLRIVPDSEVAELQMRGSARRTAMRREREVVGGPSSMASWSSQIPTEGTAGIVAAWFALAVVLLVGGRSLVTSGSQPIGQMLPFPARDSLIDAYRSGWWDSGLGQTSAVPTGFALLAAAATLVAGHMALLHTLGILGAVFLGYVGVWRLAAVLGDSRARLAATVAYAAIPLPTAAIGAGRWSVLAAYALVPWSLHALRRVSGWAVPSRAADTDNDVVDLVVVPTGAERARLVAGLVLVLAIGLAFVPALVLVVVVCAVLWLIATALLRGSVVTAAIAVAASIVGAVGALVLDLPWSADLFGGDAWDAVAGPPLASPRDLGLRHLAQFDIGPAPLSTLTLALYGTALVGVLITRGWRLGWASRAASLVIGFLALAVLDDRGSLPVRLPEPGVLLAPVAVGVALGVGCAVAALGHDLRGVRFGLTQPLAVVGVLALFVGVVPGLAGAADGSYDQPQFTLVEQIESSLPSAAADGDYRTLVIGDPRLVPVASSTYVDGVAYALLDDGPIEAVDAWSEESDVQQRLVRELLDAAAERDTARVGRALAPLAVRFVVVPLNNGVDSTVDDPLPVPVGLVDAFDAQLDIQRVYSQRDIVVFENTAWVPTRSMLSPVTADASGQAGLGALVRTETSGARAVMIGSGPDRIAAERVGAGTLHLAVPVDDHWRVSVDGNEIEGRPAFGYSSVYEIPADAVVSVEYVTGGARNLWIAVQLGLWVVTVLATTTLFTRLGGRRRPAPVPGGPILSLGQPVDDEPFSHPPVPPEEQP